MRRKEMIRRVMKDIECNLEQYSDFVVDCVNDRVENWETEELKNWLGLN